MPEPFINKKSFKRRYNHCCICGESDPDVLDVHRWNIPGCKGGKYTSDNSLTVCSKCHRLIHKNRIKIIGIFDSTGGKVVNFTDKDNNEHFEYI